MSRVAGLRSEKCAKHRTGVEFDASRSPVASAIFGCSHGPSGAPQNTDDTQRADRRGGSRQPRLPPAEPARAADRGDGRARGRAGLPEPEDRPDQRPRGSLQRDLLRAVRRPRRVHAGGLQSGDRADARAHGELTARGRVGERGRGPPSPSCCGALHRRPRRRPGDVRRGAGGRPALRAALREVLDGMEQSAEALLDGAPAGRRHSRHPRPGPDRSRAPRRLAPSADAQRGQAAGADRGDARLDGLLRRAGGCRALEHRPRRRC